MLHAFRTMRTQMVRAGLFRSSKSFYAWKLVSLLAMYSTAAAVLMNGQDTWSACLVASFLVALCWQQSGWLAHDFLHHQVFQNRRLNTAVGYVVGNVLQGFSVHWWKSKHNTHHAVPNECTDDAKAVDPGVPSAAAALLKACLVVHDCPGGQRLSVHSWARSHA
jgi:acyl-lipid Delta6-acetylenase / acyl-lipid (9-3)-desaturase